MQVNTERDKLGFSAVLTVGLFLSLICHYAELTKSGSATTGAVAQGEKQIRNHSILFPDGENLTVLDENLQAIRAYPLPFNYTQSIRFHLKHAADLKLQIFDRNGELIRTLMQQRLGAGMHQWNWEGGGGQDTAFENGDYFYRLQSGRKILLGKMRLGQ